MTNKTKSNVQEENLEHEALVAKKRIESISLSLGSINKRLKQIHDILAANLIINQGIAKLDANLIINQGIAKLDANLIINQGIAKLYANLIINQEIAKLDANLIINQEIAKSDNTEIKKHLDKAITEIKEHPDKAIFTKKRNKLENTPDRLWFKMHGIYFFIEFTIRCAKNDEKHLEGCFIYGTSYYIEKDKVEDKPIVSFFIDEHKIITANNDFENESWTCEKEHIIDLHLRTLDKIWGEALYLINKDKFQ